jgi:hypothetical protein
VDRRKFLLQSSLAAVGAPWLNGASPSRYLIRTAPNASFRLRLAERELLRGLTRILPEAEVRLSDEATAAQPGDLIFELRLAKEKFPGTESYSIAAGNASVTFSAASESGLLHAVFDFLERQGAFFGIDGESYPITRAANLQLPAPNQPWTASPRFAVRGLLPWPDFLNCISVYNEEDFRAYFENMLRMRFNMFGMHVYTGDKQWAESYLSFEFGGAGHLGFLDNTASHRWGYLPERTSRYGMGAAQLYDSEVFGSDATRLGRDPWETAARTRQLLDGALRYAGKLGLRTGVGFEPYQVPDEIWRALPPEVKPKTEGTDVKGPRFDIESVTARDLLETRLAQLLEAYPEVDYVWLWEDEDMNWESRKSGQPLSVTPFAQAHDFLRRNAPKKKLVVCGWGGVARHFADFHKRLPGDIVFACLSDSLGWDPVNEVFGKLEGRERWPIPWLEDDPSMWLPQFHVHRFERDMNSAAQMGCQGLLGIHWRHRIVDPTAAYQARFSWDSHLAPRDHYRAFARTQAAGARVARLAETLDDADRERKLLCTFSGEVKDGHAVQQEFSGDYDEAFEFWRDFQIQPAVVESQKQVAAALGALAAAAASPEEKERLAYLAGHVEFLVPYASAWVLAHRVHVILQAALELKQKGKTAEARDKVAREAVPLWLELAPEVRHAILAFQRIVATRNDLGTLASMHNKLVRLALVRLRLSMKEFLGTLPPETEAMFHEAMRPDSEAPARLFVPTRPTMLASGETVRVMVVAPGEAPVRNVTLHVRPRGSVQWSTLPARLLGRRTYEAHLGPFHTGAALAEYYFSADVGTRKLTAPPEPATHPYLVTLA